MLFSFDGRLGLSLSDHSVEHLHNHASSDGSLSERRDFLDSAARIEAAKFAHQPEVGG